MASARWMAVVGRRLRVSLKDGSLEGHKHLAQRVEVAARQTMHRGDVQIGVVTWRQADRRFEFVVARDTVVTHQQEAPPII